MQLTISQQAETDLYSDGPCYVSALNQASRTRVISWMTRPRLPR
jgi:hypothetical protein